MNDKIASIPSYANITYNPLGQILTRQYINGLNTTYTYTSDSFRLARIVIPSAQNLSYFYDFVGNIVSVNDTVNSKFHRLYYDGLNRMINVTIGSDVYRYSYNSLGNVMSVVRNNESKKYVYNNLAHAPSSIIDGKSGVDIYLVNSLNTNSLNRTFEFFVINDANITLTGVNVSVNFGNGVNINLTNINLSDDILFFIQSNYSRGGDYIVKFNVTSNGINDYEWKNIKFGIHADNLSSIYSNVSYRVFEFDLSNDLVEGARNVSWNCSDGINSIKFNLSTNQSVMDFIAHNYTTPGSKTFICNITSVDGNDTIISSFNVDGLKIEEYDVLYSNVSRRIITYDLKNYFESVEANLTMIGDSSVSKLLNITANENIMVFSEFNYSNDSYRDLSILVSSNQSVDRYTERFNIRGATIENYIRIPKNYSTSIFMFDIKNHWYAGYVNWSISDPNIINSTYLNNNQSIIVFIENNYTIQGVRRPEINATLMCDFISFIVSL